MHSKVLACVGVPVVAVLLVGCRSCVKGNGEETSPAEDKASSVEKETPSVEKRIGPTPEFISQHYGENQTAPDKRPLHSTDSNSLVNHASWPIGENELTKEWLENRPMIQAKDVAWDFYEIRYDGRLGDVQVFDASSEEFEPAEAETPSEYPLSFAWDKEKVFKRKRGESVIAIEARCQTLAQWVQITKYPVNDTDADVTLKSWRRNAQNLLRVGLKGSMLRVRHDDSSVQLSDGTYPKIKGGDDYFNPGVRSINLAHVSRSAMKANKSMYYHMADGTIVIASKNDVYYRVYRILVIIRPPYILWLWPPSGSTP